MILGSEQIANLIFVQATCIFGMDFLSQADIIIDAGQGKLQLNKPSSNNCTQSKSINVYCNTVITLPPNEETKIIFNTPPNFDFGLISSHPQLTPGLTVMDGVIAVSYTHLTLPTTPYV